MITKAMRMSLLLVAVCGMLLLYSPHGCKDPSEFEPPSDSLYPPPEPPQLSSPMNHYVFMDPDAMPGTSFFIYVDLQWDAVADAEVYQLELVTDTLPPNIMICENNSRFFVIHDDVTKLCEYHWRVRAGSSQWEAMTDWSQQWYFEARWCPFGPELISPVNYSTIMVDSLPALLAMQWNIITEAEFYEVKIFADSLLIDSNVVFSNSYEFVVQDTSMYCWQVRAGSSFWQHYSFPSQLFYFFVQLR